MLKTHKTTARLTAVILKGSWIFFYWHCILWEKRIKGKA